METKINRLIQTTNDTSKFKLLHANREIKHRKEVDRS